MAIDLTTKSTQSFVRERVREAVKYDDKQAALDIINLFRRELPSQQAVVETQPGLLDEYKKAWITAQFICLPSIAEDEFFDLLRENLVDGLKIPEYDIVEKIGLRLSFLFLESEQVNLLEQLQEVVRKNEELIGAKNIKVNGKLSLPTIQNWLADYDTYPSETAKRGDYEQITYLSKSQNVAFLNDEEKKILLEVMDLYDSLKNLLSYYHALPEATEAQLNDPTNTYQYYPGAELVDSIDENINPNVSGAQIDAVVPSAPEASKYTFDVKNPQEIIQRLPDIKPTPAPVASTPAPAAAPKPPVKVSEPAKPVDNTIPVEKLKLASEPRREDEYIIEKTPTPAPVVAPKAADESKKVVDDIKNKLAEQNIRTSRPPLNIQDFLNERHNRGARGGIVFDPANIPPSKPRPVAQKPEVNQTVPEPKPQEPKAPEVDIAKKLEDLRKRKNS